MYKDPYKDFLFGIRYKEMRNYYIHHDGVYKKIFQHIEKILADRKMKYGYEIHILKQKKKSTVIKCNL